VEGARLKALIADLRERLCSGQVPDDDIQTLAEELLGAPRSPGDRQRRRDTE
jgi:hypothetical protein